MPWTLSITSQCFMSLFNGNFSIRLETTLINIITLFVSIAAIVDFDRKKFCAQFIRMNFEIVNTVEPVNGFYKKRGMPFQKVAMQISFTVFNVYFQLTLQKRLPWSRRC